MSRKRLSSKGVFTAAQQREWERDYKSAFGRPPPKRGSSQIEVVGKK